MGDREEFREHLRALFSEREQIPADVMPYREATTEERRRHLLTLNATVGTWAEVTIPGEVITNPDGVPIGMTPVRTEIVYRGGGAFTREHLARAGLTPEDVPNLIVLKSPSRTNREEDR